MKSHHKKGIDRYQPEIRNKFLALETVDPNQRRRSTQRGKDRGLETRGEGGRQTEWTGGRRHGGFQTADGD